MRAAPHAAPGRHGRIPRRGGARHITLTGTAAALRPFEDDRAPQLKAAWAELHDSARGLWPDTDKEADDSSVRSVLPAAQRAYGEHSANAAREDLLSKFAGGEEWRDSEWPPRIAGRDV